MVHNGYVFIKTFSNVQTQHFGVENCTLDWFIATLTNIMLNSYKSSDYKGNIHREY